ncbi:MAG: hypothetical protein ICV78_27685 [Tolypothrix sp. Co-bin9]|nr:hypothetical protein [Tolypothrix sp. Co-bin9]
MLKSLQPNFVGVEQMRSQKNSQDIGKIELSVLSCQCLDQRIPEQASLQQEISSWEVQRNTQGSKVD